MTPEQAAMIAEAHDIRFAVEAEREFMEDGNPGLLAAYEALLALADK